MCSALTGCPGGLSVLNAAGGHEKKMIARLYVSSDCIRIYAEEGVDRKEIRVDFCSFFPFNIFFFLYFDHLSTIFYLKTAF